MVVELPNCYSVVSSDGRTNSVLHFDQTAQFAIVVVGGLNVAKTE